MKPKGRDLLKTLIMLMEDQYGCKVKYELEGEEDEEVQIERKRADTAGGTCHTSSGIPGTGPALPGPPGGCPDTGPAPEWQSPAIVIPTAWWRAAPLDWSCP